MERLSPLPWNATAEKINGELQKLRTDSNSQKIIAWILGRLQNLDDLASRILLLSELAGEYAISGDNTNAERALRERIALSQDAAPSWISLADHFLYSTGDLAAARVAIERALRQALSQNAFVRQAAGTRIRIALALRDYPHVEETLRLLLTDAAKSSDPDTAYETDFVQRIPPRTVDIQLMQKYLELARQTN